MTRTSTPAQLAIEAAAAALQAALAQGLALAVAQQQAAEALGRVYATMKDHNATQTPREQVGHAYDDL